MALLVQVTKKSTPLFSKPAHLVNAHPITALHQLIKHLADSLGVNLNSAKYASYVAMNTQSDEKGEVRP